MIPVYTLVTHTTNRRLMGVVVHHLTPAMYLVSWAPTLARAPRRIVLCSPDELIPRGGASHEVLTSTSSTKRLAA